MQNHLNSKKHETSKEKLSTSKSREKDIIDSLLRIYDAEHHPVDETLPMDRVYRVKVLKSFLRAAIPLTKLDLFYDILEENALRLTDRHHMSDLIPFLCSQEQSDIKTE